MSSTDKTPKSFLIGDQWISSQDDIFESINPANGQCNYLLSSANQKHVDEAVSVATHAFHHSAWRTLLPHQRALTLHRIADGMEQNNTELARLQMIENGKVWNECVNQVKSAIATFRYYASVCETLEAQVTPSRGNYLSMTEYEPYGVIAAITPWNSPLTMEAQKIAPALAAGNAVILKPSEITSSPALTIARIALEAGLPPGILNVLTGLGSTVGSALVAHPRVKMVSFTGGTVSGKAIARIAAEKLMPVALELGGKSPHIVFEDADQDSAITAIIGGIFEGSGQSCIAGSRLYIQQSIFDAFLHKLIKQVKTIAVQLPDTEGAQMGPIATFSHRDKIEAMVKKAQEEGAEILLGGTRPQAAELLHGAFYLPTIIGNLTADTSIVKEEVFGPVLCVLPFKDEEDLITQANYSIYGLAAGIWTNDYKRALRIARQLEAGTIWINTYKQLSISTPFGGFKQSGLGREKGISGLRLYQQTKGIYFGL